jgi:hypothetical protein
MVSAESIQEQLKRIGFKQHGWGKAEIRELPNILLPDEHIYECVNGIYEAGFALLVATEVRLLLIDKKMLNFLTIEDLRFDMINEIDYSHRLTGAYISISTGSKTLKFRSYNQPRLRKLIGHVQHCMAEAKQKQSSHQEGQNQHLEQINQQLQAYLTAQYQHQEELQRHLINQNQQQVGPPPPKPDPQLSDYLLAQRLLADYRQQIGQLQARTDTTGTTEIDEATPQVEGLVPGRPQLTTSQTGTDYTTATQDDLYNEGMQEVYGKRRRRSLSAAASSLLIYLETLKRNSTTSSDRIV